MRAMSRCPREAGNTVAVLLGVVVICSGLSGAVLFTSFGRQREAEAGVSRERAFQLAEAGVDWAIAQLRRNAGVPPAIASETRTADRSGSFTIRYTRGTENRRDDDGDGLVDETDERNFTVLLSTGHSGDSRRTLEIVLRRAVEVPAFDSGVQINVETPILDLNGRAFRISGEEHLLDGTLDPSRPAKPGIASPADVAYVQSQIEPRNYGQITGAGGTPSIRQIAPIDLDRIVEQARRAATVIVEPGTHTHMDLGTPTEAGIVVAYCRGDLHLSGGADGAGALVVDGDLRISGGFTWVGIILVRGRVDFVGGGSGKRLIGVLGVGEEVANQGPEAKSETTEVTVAGTVDMFYSTDAVELASQKLAIVAVLAWREVANP